MQGHAPGIAASARVGAFLAEHRRWIPLTFLAPALLVPATRAPLMLAAGAGLVAAGTAATLAASAVDQGGVLASRQPQQLATTGLFAWTRNPRALAALLAWAGLALLTGLPWVVAMALIAWGTTHALVVRHEEAALEAAHGEAWERYRRRVPRWLPRRPVAALAARPDWPAALRHALGTVLVWAALAAACALRVATA